MWLKKSDVDGSLGSFPCKRSPANSSKHGSPVSPYQVKIKVSIIIRWRVNVQSWLQTRGSTTGMRDDETGWKNQVL